MQKNKPDPTFDKVRFILVASEKKIYSFLITTDRVKLFNRPENLDFFNLYEVFKKRVVIFFLQYFIRYAEFAVGDKVL